MHCELDSCDRAATCTAQVSLTPAYVYEKYNVSIYTCDRCADDIRSQAVQDLWLRSGERLDARYSLYAPARLRLTVPSAQPIRCN